MTRKAAYAKLLASKLPFDPKSYEYSDRFVPGDIKRSPMEAHTVHEMVEALRKHPKSTDIDAQVLVMTKDGRYERRIVRGREAFLKAWNANSRLKEADVFATDGDISTGERDFISLIGGPFNKQLYLRDYQRMIGLAYYAYCHDPAAKAVINITRDFVLGRGFSLVCDDKRAKAKWEAFSAANDLPAMMESIVKEMPLYGEILIWNLPNRQTTINWDEKTKKGLIPRIRLLDPSTCWEIITQPTDITDVIAYQLVYPTQYQMYTTPGVPSAKFVYQQIPAEEIWHYKLNVVTGEKRGRSELFPVLGYCKRLRDSVNYRIIGLQKQAAYSIDTEIDGDEQDISNYIEAQNAQGAIHPPGSEFVHSTKVKRTYQGAPAGGDAGQSETFAWCLSMISIGTGIPVSYLGTHLSGEGTRASALVATEPVAKMFEKKQQLVKEILERIWNKYIGPDIDHEFVLPEIVTQDRDQKVTGLIKCHMMGLFSKQTVAEIAAKEYGIRNFEWEKEKEKIADETESSGVIGAPLTTPGAKVPGLKLPNMNVPKLSMNPGGQRGLSSQDRKEIANDSRTL